MILLSVLKCEAGFHTRLGLGVVNIADESGLRKRLGYEPRAKKLKARYAEILKQSENRFLIRVRKTGGKWFEKIYKTFDGAKGALGSIEWC